MKKRNRKINRRSFLKKSGLYGFGTASLFGGFGGRNASGLTLAEAAEIADATDGKLDLPKFVRAKPVWAAGREKEMNVTLVFSAAVEYQNMIRDDNDVENGGTVSEGIRLRMTGSTIAKVTVNGRLAGYGPARGPHGWFRVDEWDLTSALTPGVNTVAVEVAGYNANSYYTLDQPSFLQAEIFDADGRVLAATDVDPKAGFTAADWTGVRLQKVQRFSFQRPFIEVYDFTKSPVEDVVLAEQPEVQLLPRRVPYPEFALLEPTVWGKTGHAVSQATLDRPWRDRSMVNISDKLKGYRLDELSVILSDDMGRLETKWDDDAEPKRPGAVYHEEDVQVVDFGVNYAGFFGLELEAGPDGAVVAVTFDEIATDDGDVNFLRLGTCSAIRWTVPAGPISLEAFEPEVGRYAKIHCLGGSFTLQSFTLREYAYPAMRDAEFTSSDKRLDKLFRAGVQTCRENAVDAFTDCPHRERAGWLCDSFFTARTAFDLTGKTDVEQVFFENYLLPECFDHLPDGMLPMCYPADHYDGIFIPNWALWFILELAEYARRSPDRTTVSALRTKVTALMKFFAGYENSDGLLERLPSWVFVEWSEANKFVHDVNYPSNILYAAALEAAGNLYGVPDWIRKGEKIRETVIRQSFDGEFFVDNAVRNRQTGALEITRNRSEVCQYFAFFFGTATPESHPELWKKLLDEFGPNRVKEGKYPEIHKANSFVGNVLRLELLSRADRGEQLLEESVAYNEYMADRTGTLWENDGPYASCNHGFASHLCHVLYRDVLGIATVNALDKTISIRLQRFDKLDSASGKQPVPGGVIALDWKKEGDKITYRLNAPDGYRVTVENATGAELVRRD